MQASTLLLFLLAVFLQKGGQVRAATCPAADDAPVITRLKSALFCNYDRLVRPVKQRSDNISIKISLDLKFLSIDEYSSQMNIHSWVVTTWDDQHLSWESSQYENITYIIVPTDEIWIPDISIYNSDLSQIMLFSSTTCVVYSTGTVKCAPDLSTPVYCDQDLRRWPYDSHNCSLHLGSWAYPGEEIDVQLDNQGYHKYLYMESNAWQLLDIQAKRVEVTIPCCPKQTHPYLDYSFKLKRHAALYAASIVVPAFVLGALAVSTFWLRGMACRVCVCCAALIGDALFLQYIGYHLPPDGDTSPDIVAYYRDAMLLAVVALVIAMTVEGLRDQEQTVEASKQQPAPQWLTQLATWLRGSGGRAGQLLLGDTDSEQQDAETAAPAVRDAVQAGIPRWVTFATLLDRTAFLALTITHIVMLVALLP